MIALLSVYLPRWESSGCLPENACLKACPLAKAA
jgi:hypothetical protein